MLFLVPVPVKRVGKELCKCTFPFRILIFCLDVTHHVLLESMDPTAQTPVNVRMMATVSTVHSQSKVIEHNNGL